MINANTEYHKTLKVLDGSCIFNVSWKILCSNQFITFWKLKQRLIIGAKNSRCVNATNIRSSKIINHVEKRRGIYSFTFLWGRSHKQSYFLTIPAGSLEFQKFFSWKEQFWKQNTSLPSQVLSSECYIICNFLS